MITTALQDQCTLTEEETEAQELGHVPKVVRRWF